MSCICVVKHYLATRLPLVKLQHLLLMILLLLLQLLFVRLLVLLQKNLLLLTKAT